MKIKNISARLHHIGGAMIAPGETAEVADALAAAIDTSELEIVEAPGETAEVADAPKRGRPPKVATEATEATAE